MNILILTNKPPYPPKDGSSLATLNIIEGLSKTGINVTVLAMTTHKHKCRIDQIPEILRSSADFSLISINTKINIFRAIINLVLSKLPYNIERFIDKNYLRKLVEILKSKQFELIQLEGLYLTPYSKTIRQTSKAQIVYRSHNIENEIWKRVSANEHNILKSWYFSVLSKRIKRMEMDLSKHVDALVAITKRDELWFLANGFDKPSVTVPSGYSPAEAPSKNSLRSNDICFLGSLDWIPNQEGLIWFLNHVWPKIIDSYPETRFHIAGRNAPEILAQKIIKRPNVVFHGEVDNAQQYLNDFSILAVPILSGSGMRVKIAEGMMLGKAIVTTSIGIEGIDAKNDEQLIIADSSEDFANAIIELIKNPELRFSLMEKAHIFANTQFDNSELTAVLVDFYKKIV
ncbi:MAG: glycosyltransferase family 4 protein [Tenuifilaceae bacterium]